MPLTDITKINKIGSWCKHRFKHTDGSVFEVECTEKEYHDLALKGAKQPSHINAVEWLVSYKGAKFDSAGGTLGSLEYYDDGVKYVVKDDKGNYYWAEYSDVVNDKIDFDKVIP